MMPVHCDTTAESVVELSVAELEREEITRLVTELACDAALRARFAHDPEDAIQRVGLHLSPETRAAVIAQAADMLGVTAGIDDTMPAAFFFFWKSGN
jgi:hypothetical protein